jgi:hypothetical protein
MSADNHIKKIMLALVFVASVCSCNSQKIHLIYFDSTHVKGNTDTTINVAIGDSVAVIHHQDDDDFEVIINGVDTIGAYNIIYNRPIYSVKLSDKSIHKVKIIYFDPNQYRQIFFSYSSGIIDQTNENETVPLFPNPAKDLLNIDIAVQGIVALINMQGEVVNAISLIEKNNQLDITDLASGIYMLRLKTSEGIVVRKFVKQ